MDTNSLSSFTNLYPVQKTLRFELKPVGKTKDWIEKNGLLEQDEQRSKDYLIVKDIIDRYHKRFIDDCLSNFQFKGEGQEPSTELLKGENKEENLQGEEQEPSTKLLEEFADLYRKQSKSQEDIKRMSDIQANLRGQISTHFTKNENYKKLNKTEILIKKELPGFAESEEKEVVEKFKDFSLYFDGFKKNRENMYSDEAKNTSIANRLINENLPKFIDNIKVFEVIKSIPEISEKFNTLYSTFKPYLKVGQIEDLFQLDFYSTVLTQIQIDVYNTIIGGMVTENESEHIMGLNQHINLYNQQNKGPKLPQFKVLYKQILSDRNNHSWLPEQFSNDQQCLCAIKEFYDHLYKTVLRENHLRLFLQNIGGYNADRIFIGKDSLTEISQKMFDDWRLINRLIIENSKESNTKTRKESDAEYEKSLEDVFNSASSFSISHINRCLQNKDKSIIAYFSNLGKTDERSGSDLLEMIEENYENVKELLASDYPENKKLYRDHDNIIKIKNFLDSILALLHFIKPLNGHGDEGSRDELFYGEFNLLWNEINQITPLYNKVRSWLTQKGMSDKKFKLYFQNKGNFLGGWVDSKTEISDNGTQYGGYLFRRKNAISEYDYYLGISTNAKLFRENINLRYTEGCYERLDYYQLKTQTVYGSLYEGDYDTEKNEMLESIKKFLQKNGLTKKIPITKSSTPLGLLKKLQEKSDTDYRKLLNWNNFSIIYYQTISNIQKTLSKINRVSSALELSEQKNISLIELMDKVEEICKERQFRYFVVDQEEIEKALVQDNKRLLLFKISNKDLSYAETATQGKRNSRGTDNLHTLYFKALMEDGQKVLDIGTADVFYRKGLVTYTEEQKRHGFHYNELKGKFKYPILKDRRYAEDKFHLHLSVSLNYLATKSECKVINKKVSIDNKVRQFIKDGGIQHIIGIDRGERNLLYLSLIDLHGNIIDQYSLNKITNISKGVEKAPKDYHKLLKDRQDNMMQSRKDWTEIDSIKELKEGYLSQVIPVICKLMVEQKAIVVLEDLNQGFKRERQKKELQIYQKFEQALITKLNYYVDKQKQANQTSGLFNALQLTSEFDSFQKLGKQSGFLFYVPASLTSKIDPVTGFANYINPKYENREKARELLGKFADIRYNAAKDYFEFVIDDYKKFNPKAVGRQNWTICSYGTRIKTFRNPQRNNEWDNVELMPTEELKRLFESNAIDYRSNLLAQILIKDDAKFYEELLRLLGLVLQMRNSITGTEVDYIISPVADENGNFYCSSNGDAGLPKDADANGAYNIARKGLWAVMQMQQADDLSDVKLAMSNEEWMRFAQEKPYRK